MIPNSLGDCVCDLSLLFCGETPNSTYLPGVYSARSAYGRIIPGPNE